MGKVTIEMNTESGVTSIKTHCIVLKQLQTIVARMERYECINDGDALMDDSGEQIGEITMEQD